MSNLRIIHDNAIHRAALSASSAAGALVASNLLTDIKSEVWRATGTSATLTATWPSAETVAGVVLPFTNFTAGATIRVRGYTLPGDASPVFDTGTVPAVLWDWGVAPSGVNDFASGGGVYAVKWFAAVPVRKLVIDLSDAGNPAGYIEAGRLVCGDYWSLSYNHSYGVQWSLPETSKHERSEAGDLITTQGSRSRQISFSLDWLTPADWSRVLTALKCNGTTTPIFLSLYPENGDAKTEYIHQIYAKFHQSPVTRSVYLSTHSSTLEFDEL